MFQVSDKDGIENFGAFIDVEQALRQARSVGHGATIVWTDGERERLVHVVSDEIERRRNAA